jgi:GNAT superfamily N-acetyltransferase
MKETVDTKPRQRPDFDAAAILRMYDEYRLTCELPGMRLEESECVVRRIDLQGREGMVIFSRLQGRNVKEVVQREIACFKELAQDFEWKVFAHDHPPDLIGQLRGIGFEIEEPETLMVLDLKDTPALLRHQSKYDLRRITNAEGMKDFVAVQNEVWGEERSWTNARLLHWLETRPDYVSIYAAYSEGRPVCCGWMDFPAAKDFAGMWSGTTLPQFRNQGFYTALVAVRLREARERGFRYAMIDAQPPSRAILEKRGFRIIGSSQGAKWRHGAE